MFEIEDNDRQQAGQAVPAEAPTRSSLRLARGEPRLAGDRQVELGLRDGACRERRGDHHAVQRGELSHGGRRHLPDQRRGPRRRHRADGPRHQHGPGQRRVRPRPGRGGPELLGRGCQRQRDAGAGRAPDPRALGRPLALVRLDGAGLRHLPGVGLQLRLARRRGLHGFVGHQPLPRHLRGRRRTDRRLDRRQPVPPHVHGVGGHDLLHHASTGRPRATSGEFTPRWTTRSGRR